LVELEGGGDGFEHGVRDAGEVALLQTGVVIGGHAGEHRDLFAAQAGDPAVAAVDGQTGLLGGDLGPAGDQEVADVGALGGHDLHGRTGPPDEGGSDRTRNDATSRIGGGDRCIVV